jgi:hypothetical protein
VPRVEASTEDINFGSDVSLFEVSNFLFRTVGTGFPYPRDLVITNVCQLPLVLDVVRSVLSFPRCHRRSEPLYCTQGVTSHGLSAGSRR